MLEANLGEALTALGEHGDVAALQEAVSAERAASEDLTRAAYPADAKGVATDLPRAEAALAKHRQP